MARCERGTFQPGLHYFVGGNSKVYGAAPVLAGSAAYTIGEARRWPVGLARKPIGAKAVYATLSAAAVIGAGLNFIGVNPTKALYCSAVLNCVVAVPALALMVLMAGSRRITAEFTVDAALRAVG